MSKRIKILCTLTLISLIFVFVSAIGRYMITKDYKFFVELSCNPESEICFIRDCDDYCPPNELSSYKTFTINASDYKQCQSNSCEQFCSSSGKCRETGCDLELNDECSTPTK